MDPHDPSGGANRYDNTYILSAHTWNGYQTEYGSFDRPVPKQWGSNATSVFSRLVPNEHQPTCCENVWDTYPSERHCPGDCHKCRGGRYCQQGAYCGPAGEGCQSGCSQCVSNAESQVQQDGTESAPVITDPVQPLPGMIDVEDEGASDGSAVDSHPVEGSGSLDLAPQPLTEEPSPAVDESAEPKEAAVGAQEEVPAANPMDLAPTGAPESSPVPATAPPQENPGNSGSARIRGPSLIRMSNQPVVIKRIFRGR
jgi:hypothetical protein